MKQTQEILETEMKASVNPLVLETLEKLINKRNSVPTSLCNKEVNKIFKSVTFKNLQSSEKLFGYLISLGRSVELILDTYFPLVAEKLGDAWVSDKLSFAQVSLALANLQLLNSKFENLYMKETSSFVDQKNVLIVVPEGEDHTFGPLTAARQLRGKGIQVTIALHSNEAELLDLISTSNKFDLIGLSSANNFMTATINRLSHFLKSNMSETVPIGLGGNIVKTYAKTNERINIDLMFSDTYQVLEEIGWVKSTQQASLFKSE